MHNLKGIAWIHFIFGILLVAFACWVLGLAWWADHATAGGNKPQHFHEGMLLLALGIVGGTLLPVGQFTVLRAGNFSREAFGREECSKF
jgi:hypothetical protein